MSCCRPSECRRVGQDAAIVRRALALLGLQHDRAGAVAEQHAGAAVVPVEDAREGLGADHQRGRGEAALDHAVGDRQSVDEAGADRLDVEGGPLGHAERRLHARRRGGEGPVRSGGGEHDEVEVASLSRPPGRARAARP